MRSTQKLLEHGFKKDQIVCEPYLHLRYQGTDCALMVSPFTNGDNSCINYPAHGDFKSAFLKR